MMSLLIILIIGIIVITAVVGIVIAIVVFATSGRKSNVTIDSGKFCNNCGAKMNSDSKFCDKCGKEM